MGEAKVEELKAAHLVNPELIGDSLFISMRSMSLDEEMRFKMHRALVGEATDWGIAGYGAQLYYESLETLVSDKRITWTESTYPSAVDANEWGYSLRCLNFCDPVTAYLVNHSETEVENVTFDRNFDDMSRILSCGEPLRSAAIAMRAATAQDNWDFKVFDKLGWPSLEGLTKTKEWPTKPKEGAAKRLAYMLATREKNHAWHPKGVMRSMCFPLYASVVPSPAYGIKIRRVPYNAKVKQGGL